MDWQTEPQKITLAWLLEAENPNVRYLALRDLLGVPESDPKLSAARDAAYQDGAIASILVEMDEAGYWVRPGAGYNPKYRSAVWSLVALSQLGAHVEMDERIAHACAYLLENSMTEHGQFTQNGAPSSTVDCLQGNLCAALLDLGYEDPRLDKAFEWMARSITGEGVVSRDESSAPLRYYAANCGANFACGYNGGRSCAWGAIKEMLAFSKLPPEKHTPLIERAVKMGVDFLFSVDPATAAYPTKNDAKPSYNWRKFGFPVFYITDILQNVEALSALGFSQDARLKNALNLIQSKQDEQGRWSLDYSYAGKTWADFGEKGEPSKWVTLRALKVLKACA